MLERGDIPTLGELKLHNGTVYRWNRPVYEVVRGRPHVRVENRVLPSGPTVVDTLANAAFYYGLVRQLVESERPIWSQMSFSAAEDNLHAGARDGLDARVYWPGVGDVPVTELVLRRLLPLAHEGLERYGVDPHARDRLMEIIERRCVRGGQRRELAEPPVPRALRRRRARPRRGAARDDGALPRPHALERAGAHVAGRLVPGVPAVPALAAAVAPPCVPGTGGMIVSGSWAARPFHVFTTPLRTSAGPLRAAPQRDARVGAPRGRA